MGLEFESDPVKSAANARKHRITFDEAESVFGDTASIDKYDPDHSDEEDRFIKLGRSDKGRLLVVVFTERGPNIRIISARRANRYEQREYEEGP